MNTFFNITNRQLCINDFSRYFSQENFFLVQFTSRILIQNDSEKKSDNFLQIKFERMIGKIFAYDSSWNKK